MAYYQFAETDANGTTPGTDPAPEWEHKGLLLPAGTTIESLDFLGRANNTEITDFEISVMVRTPDDVSR